MRRLSLASWGTTVLATSLLLAHCSSTSSPMAGAAEGGAVPLGSSCSTGGSGLTSCGTSGDGSCCESLRVQGGTFLRSYDGISINGGSKGYPATVSDFALDKYEVTVGRFRQFVSAEAAGWRPAVGSGKHSYLAGGGLNGGAEPGWEASWNANLATRAPDWTSNLACEPDYSTWTEGAGANEEHPINCVDWYEAYAFCIWDGGFLPSEAEWNYAASGGSEQRLYPWSAAFPPGGATTLDCDQANYATDWPSKACVSSGTNKVGSESPLGDGKWGQSDLAGNVFEWTLDWDESPYAASCDNCADLTASPYRVIRGGGFDGLAVCLLNSLRETSTPLGRSAGIGFRCARPPS
jgi:formylglycine-generating enzyme